MAAIRRNIRWVGLSSIVLAALLGGWWLLGAQTPRAWATSSYEPLDAVSAERVARLRSELGLDDDTLIVLNPGDEQAQRILASLRAWYEVNSVELRQHWSALADERALVRRCQSQMRIGEELGDALDNAKTQLATLQSQYEDYIAAARRSVWQELSDEQRALAERMRGQSDVAMPYRPLPLSAQQRSDLAAAQTAYRKRLATAEDIELRAELRAEYQAQVAGILGPASMQQLATLREYLGPASQRVVAALQRVLPVEPEG